MKYNSSSLAFLSSISGVTRTYLSKYILFVGEATAVRDISPTSGAQHLLREAVVQYPHGASIMALVRSSPYSPAPGRPPQAPVTPHSSCNTLTDNLSDSDDTFFVPRPPRRPLLTPQTEADDAPSNMVLISTTSRAWGDEFCDISLENPGDVKSGSGGGYDHSAGPCGKSKVKENLKHIACKIKPGRKHVYDDLTRELGDLSTQVDLPPFEIYCDHEEGSLGSRDQRPGSLRAYSGSCKQTCKQNGPQQASVKPQEAPHAPPASPPAGYCAFARLMQAADDATYGDSDTANGASDGKQNSDK